MLLYMPFAEIEFSFHNYFMLYLSCAEYKLLPQLLLHTFQRFLRYYSLESDNSNLSPTEEDYNLHLILLQLL